MRHAIARWTPTGDVVRDRFGRLFEDAFNDMLRPYGTDAEAVSSRTWIPRVDIRENTDGLTLLMDVPGLGKDDLNITLENNVLTIAGERSEEHTSELQSQSNLVCRLLLEKKNTTQSFI